MGCWKEGMIGTSSKSPSKSVKATQKNCSPGKRGVTNRYPRRTNAPRPPQILTKTCPNTGMKLEHYKEVIIDVDAEYSGSVVNALTGARKGMLVEMMDDKQGKTRMKFEVPSCGLLGFGPEIAMFMRGTAVMHHCYLEDREYAGNMNIGLDKRKLVANDSGKAILFALEALSAQGTLFVAPVGEKNKSGNLEVNPIRTKATSNMRTQSKDEKLYLAPPKRLLVAELIGYMSGCGKPSWMLVFESVLQGLRRSNWSC
eukprot:CCRYP_019386-RB/>CCRYP_019386-RB protein AED:0.10 eAED:0.10 QI:1137/0/0.25/1/0.33/0.5/4/0/255